MGQGNPCIVDESVNWEVCVLLGKEEKGKDHIVFPNAYIIAAFTQGRWLINDGSKCGKGLLAYCIVALAQGRWLINGGSKREKGLSIRRSGLVCRVLDLSA